MDDFTKSNRPYTFPLILITNRTVLHIYAPMVVINVIVSRCSCLAYDSH